MSSMFNLNSFIMSKNAINAADVVKKAATGFVSSETGSEVLKPGEHITTIVKMRVLDSFQALDGSAKNKEFEWKTPTPLVAITFAADNRAIVDRFHLLGYKKYDDLTPEEKESGGYTVSEEGNYAIKDGDRIVDDENTKAAHNKLSRLFNVIGLPVGSTLEDLKEMIRERSAEAWIKVEERQGTKGAYNAVASFGKPKVKADITAEAFK